MFKQYTNLAEVSLSFGVERSFGMSFGLVDTCSTSLSDDPTIIIFDPFVTPSRFKVISSFARPLIII